MKTIVFKVFTVATLVTLMSGSVFTVSAQQKKTKEEIQAEVQRLQQRKQVEAAKRAQAAEASRPSGQDFDRVIDRYEKMYDQCAYKKSDRCADIMYTLGSLYYDQAKERANSNQTKPDYRKSLNMYWQLAREYPNFPKLPEAYFQISVIYLVSGKLDTTRIVLEQLVQRFPKSPRVSGAHFRLGDLAFLDNNFNKAKDHFQKVKEREIDAKSWEITQDRLAQIKSGTVTTKQGGTQTGVAYGGGQQSSYTQTQRQQPTTQTVSSGGASDFPPLNELNAAIRDASHYLNKNIPKGSKIVILNVQSHSSELSDYIIDELIANAINDKVFTVVDRQQLDAISAEQNFQMSGAVDDNEALAIGKFFGAQTIISGAVSRIGTVYRIRIRALEVQTAQVQGQYNRNIDPQTNK